MIYLWIYLAGMVLWVVVCGIMGEGILLGMLGFGWPVYLPFLLLYWLGCGIRNLFESKRDKQKQ